VSTVQRIECQWCHSQSPAGARTCENCGAPLDVANLVSDSGWREAPRVRDMTELSFGKNSSCQLEGELVPVAELRLGEGDSVIYEHHVMLWKDEGVRQSMLRLAGGVKRMFGGLPYRVVVASGPGRVAFSRDAAGELIVLRLHPEMELDVREHAFLVASHTIDYSFVPIKGFRNHLHGGQGMYMDRFVTKETGGLLILHGFGNVFERLLQQGESILVEPGGFLYKDSSVTMSVEQQKVRTGMLRHGLYLARMTGPGRVGIQSMYHHHAH
jgi:uncharacterized protein (AIM24 family)